jgi:succinoglycan biosynthesis protein ExoA
MPQLKSLEPFISIIMPVRNESASILRTLKPLLAQNYDPARYEILVVDGESTDGTPQLVRELEPKHSNLKLLTNPGRLSSAARNIGIRQARGDLLVIVDGHSDVETGDYLREVAASFERSGADCLGRPQPLDVAGASPLQQAVAMARASWLGHHPASHIYSDMERKVPPQSVAVAYRRSVFEKIGPFDEAFDACEDVEFNHRVDKAGLTCVLSPNIRVRYQPRSSLRGLFRQMARYGRGRVRLLCKHPETFSLASLVPGIFVLALIIGGMASCFSATAAICYSAALAVYTAVVLTISGWIALKSRNLRPAVWLPFVFPTIHIGCGVGALVEAASVLLRPGAIRTGQSPAAAPR